MLASSPSPSKAFGPRQHPSLPLSPRQSSPLFSPRAYSRKSAPSSPKGAVTTPSSVSFKSQEPSTRGSNSSKGQTSDAGTQYTPPDWPPTSSKSSLPGAQTFEKQSNHQDSIAKSPLQSRGSSSTVADKEVSTSPPPEPRLRVTPQSSLQQISESDSHEHPSVPNAAAESSTTSSPPKKQRALGREVKILPTDYTKCDTAHLSILISDLLVDLIRHNDEIPLRDGQLTRFHSRSPPAISVKDYLNRLIFHATLSGPVLLSMICYIDRLCAAFPTFTINSLTVHRFLITAATVAAKGLCDVFWTNNTYAKVGGVQVKELHLLELELLMRIGWRIIPDPNGLVDYYKNLIERSQEYEMEGSTSSSELLRDSLDSDSDADSDASMEG